MSVYTVLCSLLKCVSTFGFRAINFSLCKNKQIQSKSHKQWNTKPNVHTQIARAEHKLNVTLIGKVSIFHRLNRKEHIFTAREFLERIETLTSHKFYINFAMFKVLFWLFIYLSWRFCSASAEHTGKL